MIFETTAERRERRRRHFLALWKRHGSLYSKRGTAQMQLEVLDELQAKCGPLPTDDAERIEFAILSRGDLPR